MKKLSMGQFAAMNMIYSRYSFAYFLDSMERLGIQNFELWTGAPHLNHFVPSLSDAGKVKKQVAERGLRIVCVTPEQVTYPQNIAAADEGLRAFSLDYFHKYIDMTAELEVDKMLCCAGWGNYDDDPEEAWQRAVDSLGSMLEHGRKAGVQLAFEILCPDESNLVNDLASTKRMMDTFDDPAFGLCLDTVPIRLSGSSIPAFFDSMGERICHVHLTDGTPTGHIPAGCGEHPISQYLDELAREDYGAYITLEIGNGSWLAKPEEATGIAFDTVRGLL